MLILIYENSSFTTIKRRITYAYWQTKRYLRSLAHNIDPIFQIGKGGINENMIKQIDDTLENRELIKVHVLQK